MYTNETATQDFIYRIADMIDLPNQSMEDFTSSVLRLSKEDQYDLMVDEILKSNLSQEMKLELWQRAKDLFQADIDRNARLVQDAQATQADTHFKECLGKGIIIGTATGLLTLACWACKTFSNANLIKR